MSMSRKDFVLVAAELAECKVGTADDTLSTADTIIAEATFAHVVNSLCAVFREINPRFDKDRFRAACGLAPMSTHPGR